jgi:hypothetical protein
MKRNIVIDLKDNCTNSIEQLNKSTIKLPSRLWLFDYFWETLWAAPGTQNNKSWITYFGALCALRGSFIIYCSSEPPKIIFSRRGHSIDIWCGSSFRKKYQEGATLIFLTKNCQLFFWGCCTTVKKLVNLCVSI